jgi:Ni/Fe-hydrogenase subunit HybB-like protein
MSVDNPESPMWRQSMPEDEDMAHQVEHLQRKHLLLDPRKPWDVNQDVLSPMYNIGPGFWLAFLVLGGLVVAAGVTWIFQMFRGIGITGLNRPVEWALYIVNFVYFIGIGHAGTFISAALRVLKVEWRRPISRAAELLTLFALTTAALFPLVHLGRTWKFYWLLPYPNERQLWPNFHSPLIWDMMAIFTYLTGSILFAYTGLLPDLAMARDHTKGWRNRLYSMLSLGWKGTEKEWAHQRTALNIFSYVIIPVMFSVHTIVSWDFAMSVQAGWHSSIFGPYFVVGALYSGVAAVIIVLAIVRKAMHWEYFLRPEHFNGMAQFLLLLSFTWTYFYFNDYLLPWYANEPIMKVLFDLLSRGGAAPIWYLMLFANILLPWATLWSKKIRSSVPILVVIAIFIQIGMYIERYIIIPVTLGRNALPFDWGEYIPHIPESLITVGAFALVAFLYLIFSRIVPIIPVWEILEGQVFQGIRRIGRALIPTRSDAE